METNFDAAELDRVFAAELIRGEKVNMPYPLRYKAALLAVAAHVREQTLREAAELVRNADVVGGGRYLREDNARDTLWEAAVALEKLAASARETGGAT